MPIAFTCPHCRTSMNVDDQYAGMTGPCASCGQPISIPGLASYAAPTKAPPIPYGPPPSNSSSGCGMVGIIVGILCLTFFGCGGVMIALLLPAVQSARSAARQAQSSNNLRQVGLALLNYETAWGTLPPAVVKDKDGKPLYSWRVLLLPYLEERELYDRFNKDESWDSPSNIALSAQIPHAFESMKEPGRCAIVGVVGPDCLLSTGDKPTQIGNCRDGLSNTIYAFSVEGWNGNWAAPVDLDSTSAQFILGIPPLVGEARRDVVVAGLGDGSVIPLNGVTPEALRAMTTCNGDEATP